MDSYFPKTEGLIKNCMSVFDAIKVLTDSVPCGSAKQNRCLMGD